MIQTGTLDGRKERERFLAAFGRADESMDAVTERARQLFPDAPVIAWEGDAQTFQFSFVSDTAEQILGYPRERWVTEPTFWADTVVHPEDRNDAIAFCALATGKCQDHDFVYRATTVDGRTVLLHDVVQVVIGERGVPTRLRGIMVPLHETSMGTESSDATAHQVTR